MFWIMFHWENVKITSCMNDKRSSWDLLRFLYFFMAGECVLENSISGVWRLKYNRDVDTSFGKLLLVGIKSEFELQ